jgi:hypothetical protein
MGLQDSFDWLALLWPATPIVIKLEKKRKGSDLHAAAAL